MSCAFTQQHSSQKKNPLPFGPSDGPGIHSSLWEAAKEDSSHLHSYHCYVSDSQVLCWTSWMDYHLIIVRIRKRKGRHSRCLFSIHSPTEYFVQGGNEPALNPGFQCSATLSASFLLFAWNADTRLEGGSWLQIRGGRQEDKSSPKGDGMERENPGTRVTLRASEPAWTPISGLWFE